MLFPYRDNIRSRRLPIVTWGLIALNVLSLVASTSAPPRDFQVLALHRGFMPARLGQLRHGRPLEILLDSLAVRHHLGRQVQVVLHETVRLEPQRGEIALSLFTSQFLHGGWLHLLGNMWFLWIFGDNVEDRLGRVKFLAFYLAGGLVANLCHWWSDPASAVPVIGASGAVGAVLGAYAIAFPWARVRAILVLFVVFLQVELPALVVLGVWFLSQVISARNEAIFNFSGGVALWAHIGGFLYGLTLMPLLVTPPAAARRATLADAGESERP